MYLKDWLWPTVLFSKVALLALNPAQALSPGASNDTTASNKEPDCDISFGRPLLDSCTSAMEAIPDTTARVLIFGLRPKAHPVSVVVPYRVMSPDGRCAVEIDFSSPTSTLDLAYPHDIRVAVQNILSSCVEDRGIGGVITGLGETYKLQVQVLQYQPQVGCFPQFKSIGPMVRSRCRALLQQIPASHITQVFGTQGDDIDVKLPRTYADSQGQCAMRFTMTDGLVSYQWHQLWSAAVAITWMCTSQGKAGWSELHWRDSVFKVLLYKPVELRVSAGNTTALETY